MFNKGLIALRKVGKLVANVSHETPGGINVVCREFLIILNVLHDQRMDCPVLHTSTPGLDQPT